MIRKSTLVKKQLKLIKLFFRDLLCPVLMCESQGY